MEMLTVKKRILCDVESQEDLIRQKSLISSKNVLKKQTTISDFSDVIYTASKNELKMMWLSRTTKVLDSFSPQKWKVNTCSLWSGYSVFGFTDI